MDTYSKFYKIGQSMLARSSVTYGQSPCGVLPLIENDPTDQTVLVVIGYVITINLRIHHPLVPQGYQFSLTMSDIDAIVNFPDKFADVASLALHTSTVCERRLACLPHVTGYDKDYIIRDIQAMVNHFSTTTYNLLSPEK